MVTIIETANRVFELTVNPGPAETPGHCDRTLCLRQLSGRPLSRRAWRRLARRVRRLLHNGGATGHVVDLVEGLAGRLRQAHGFFRWDIDFVTLIGLVAQLQLALRHPANVGETANQVRESVHLAGRTCRLPG